MASSQRLEPASGTRDFLADGLRKREAALATIRDVFERYGFEPLQTPAFERIETLTGKYGDEGDKLIFKILRRGEHEASGEADLALRYDLTVPLARVVAAYGNQLPSPYKRYAIGPVWRADRPGKGRYREFTQCDIDVVGSSSRLADVECLAGVADALDALDIEGLHFLVNSRNALFGLLEAYRVPVELGGDALVTLDKLDKVPGEEVVRELEGRGVDPETARALVGDMVAEDAADRMRQALSGSEQGQAGLAEIDRVVQLAAPHVGADRIAFVPRLVRGLDYYTGPIWEVEAADFSGSIASGGRYDNLVAALGGPDVPASGGSIGVERIISQLGEHGTDEAMRLDVAVTILEPDATVELVRITGELRRSGLRTDLYLGSSDKFAKQMKWANQQGARFAVIYGADERSTGEITIRDMDTGDQERVPIGDVSSHLEWKVRGASA